MAVRPVPHSLAALSLALGLAGAAPAFAQTYIGSGNVQVNLQALDQLGGARGAGAAASQTPLIGSTGKAPKQQLMLQTAQPAGPQPLLGETGSATSTTKLRRPGSSSATRKAAAPAAPKTATAPAIAPAPAPAAAPAPAPAQTQVPAQTQSAPPAVATAPAAPVPSAPAASSPTPPAAEPAPPAAPQAGTPMPVVPAPAAPSTAAAPLSAAPAPAPAPAPQAAAPAPQAASPAPAAPSPQAARPPQMAAAPPPPRPTPAPAPQGGVVTLAFPGGQGELPAAGDLTALDALARQYANGEDRLQIRAYAASTVSDGGSGARRLSLTRALAVRQYLIDKGIRSTRIDVRALGAPTDGTAADRVEVAPVGR